MQVSGDKAAEESSRNSTSSTNQQFSSSAAVSLHNTAVVQSAVKSALLWFSDETHYCFVALHWDALLHCCIETHYCCTNESFSDHSMHRSWVLVPPNLAGQNTPAQKSYRIPMLKNGRYLTEYPRSTNGRYLTEYPAKKMGDILQNRASVKLVTLRCNRRNNEICHCYNL